MESYSSSERPWSVTAFARALTASFKMRSLSGGGRCRYPLLIVLLETGHPLDGGCRRVKLLVRDVRRLLGETGRRRLDLSVCCGDEENPRGKQQDSSGRTHQNSHNCLLGTLRPLAMSKWCENSVGRKQVRGKSGSS